MRTYFSAIIAKLKITSAFFTLITLTITNITAFYAATAATFFTSYILHKHFFFAKTTKYIYFTTLSYDLSSRHSAIDAESDKEILKQVRDNDKKNKF